MQVKGFERGTLSKRCVAHTNNPTMFFLFLRYITLYMSTHTNLLYTIYHKVIQIKLS